VRRIGSFGAGQGAAPVFGLDTGAGLPPTAAAAGTASSATARSDTSSSLAMPRRVARIAAATREERMATIETNPQLGQQVVADAKRYVLHSWSVF
jgi:hypothetical protein